MWGCPARHALTLNRSEDNFNAIRDYDGVMRLIGAGTVLPGTGAASIAGAIVAITVSRLEALHRCPSLYESTIDAEVIAPRLPFHPVRQRGYLATRLPL